jgi:hypothetical protein
MPSESKSNAIKSVMHTLLEADFEHSKEALSPKVGQLLIDHSISFGINVVKMEYELFCYSIHPVVFFYYH